MLETLFTHLTHAVEGGMLIASLAALAWGVLSILLSPCHLASIPLIVGFIGDQGPTTTPRRAMALSSLFAVGILLTIALIGVLTAAAGRMLGDLGAWANYTVAVIFFAVGLHLLGVIPMPWSSPTQIGMARKGLLAAFILGLIFGIALGPCTFAFMAPMLGITFRLAAKNFVYGAILLTLYGIGHCSVIVIAGTFSRWVQNYLNWTASSRSASVLRCLCGVLVLAGGLYLIYTAR